jgi:O-antigen ligase
MPVAGIAGYMAHYHMWPESHWWGIPVQAWGLRYSLILFLSALAGFLLSLRKPRTFLTKISSQEILILILIALHWAFIPFDDKWRPEILREDLTLKITKVLIFTLLMGRVVVRIEQFRVVMWTILMGTLYLGYEAFIAPPFEFAQSRLNGIGGPDFGESSFLGAHFVMMLPIIGVLYLRRGWFTKTLCIAAGALAVNGFILTRTRAALIALIVGVVIAFITGVGGNRRKLILYGPPALIVLIFLIDPGFMTRMTNWSDSDGQLELSAQRRLDIWALSINIIRDYPFGIGPGNFPRYIADYDADLFGRDSHNTLIRCTTELGVQGLMLYLLLILNAIRLLMKASRVSQGTTHHAEIRRYGGAIIVSIVIMMAAGMFMTNLYIEACWWFVIFPVCLLRTAESLHARAKVPVRSRRPRAISRGPVLPAPGLRPSY